MNCPVCQRSLAPTLSICPACGAMKNDSVREELESKISSGPLVSKQLMVKTSPEPMTERPSIPTPPQPAVAKKTVTANLVSHKTSKTLVGFQNKNAALPDWRIQLQNAVQQRKGGNCTADTTDVLESKVQHVSRGNLALKSEPTPQPEIEISQQTSDPRVASAMRRISESRKNFFEVTATPVKAASPVQKTPVRPFGVVAPINSFSLGSVATTPAKTITPQKPMLVALPKTVAEKLDTNKLPPIKKSAESSSEIENPFIARVKIMESDSLELPFTESKRIHITSENFKTLDAVDHDLEADEIEDLAPFSMRFGAGLFDFIIGGFATMLALSPFAFTSSNWFTGTVFLTFVGTWALISFIYMTSCLGFFGKTMGMRLFQLELVDAVENEYPTLRQAAVNSSVFLATVAFAGAPFFMIFFNEEKRALHDLVSGTILVREF